MPRTGQAVVLVVEDELALREYIATFIREVGYSVLETDTAEQAIAIMDTGTRIDIVVTDINLNGKLTGWDLAERFRAAQPKYGSFTSRVTRWNTKGWCRKACFSRSLTILRQFCALFRSSLSRLIRKSESCQTLVRKASRRVVNPP